jgi:hypothetical protein
MSALARTAPCWARPPPLRFTPPEMVRSLRGSNGFPSRRGLMLLRVIVGIATFFDAYTVLAIVFAMPQLVTEWKLTPAEVGMIISAGYVGQLIGAVLFGSLAEKIGRLRTLFITIVLFVSMDVACLFAWGAASMIAFRFFQGVGTGGEVPVASAYINEFIGAEKRGRFFLLYEVIFPIGLMFAGMAGFFLVPIYGWKAMFVVGLVPSVLTIPLRWLMPESPRWLASKGRIAEANAVVKLLEDDATRRGAVLPEPIVRAIDSMPAAQSDWRELFKGIRLHDQQRPDHVAPNALRSSLSLAPADEPRLWLDYLRRRRRRLDRVRSLHRQGRPQALVRDRVPPRCGAVPRSRLARRNLGNAGADPRHRRLRGAADDRILALSLLR